MYYRHIKSYIQLMRLDKPIGSLLLLWPTLWALWIATHGRPSGSVVVIFVLGVIVMRSAGCVINDLADRNFDGAVMRTKNRPLVTGMVSIKQAVILVIILVCIGFLLVLQLNVQTVLLSFIALGLALVYPFAKRYTYLPQLWLGAAFAWSVPMAFAAENVPLAFQGWLLYGIAVLWPLAYDSIYALMDREDDIKIQLKSSAIWFGRYDLTIIFSLQGVVIAALLLLGYCLNLRFYYYIAVFLACLLICYQYYLVRQRNASSYYRAFANNHWLGFIIFLGLFCNYNLN